MGSQPDSHLQKLRELAPGRLYTTTDFHGTSTPDIPAKFGRDRSVNAGGDVEQTNGRTNPNYSMIVSSLKNPELRILVRYEAQNFTFPLIFSLIHYLLKI